MGFVDAQENKFCEKLLIEVEFSTVLLLTLPIDAVPLLLFKLLTGIMEPKPTGFGMECIVATLLIPGDEIFPIA